MQRAQVSKEQIDRQSESRPLTHRIATVSLQRSQLPVQVCNRCLEGGYLLGLQLIQPLTGGRFTRSLGTQPLCCSTALGSIFQQRDDTLT